MLPSAKALMVQGTTSDAGKSVLVAGLGRLLARNGISVAPFKSQNMALNSAVTPDGGEIGRAQAFQAFACNIPPSVDMNPVLLKPSSDCQAQIIVQGNVVDASKGIGNSGYKAFTLPKVLESFQRLSSQFDCILIEGAGSPAEVNLRENDIANMGFAEEADVPVIIIADIDKGGVFAHLIGTLACLSQSERDRIIGFVINRFRGDIKLLEPGLQWLEAQTGKPVLGVIPYLYGLTLDAEDAVDVEQRVSDSDTLINIAVPVFPRISNHTDFDTLRLHPQVNLQYVPPGNAIPDCDVIILPGSKSVISDLAHLREYGWDKQIARHLRYGGKLIGICGGYQMLGDEIKDPLAIESGITQAKGLGYIRASTQMDSHKVLTQKTGVLSLLGKCAQVTGYEIHMGRTRVQGQPIIECDGDTDGVISEDGQILGTYWHGIFDSPDALKLLLEWAGLKEGQCIDIQAEKDKSLELLADTLADCLALEKLWPTWNLK